MNTAIQQYPAVEFQDLLVQSPFFPKYLAPIITGWRFKMMTVELRIDRVIDEMVLESVRRRSHDPSFWLWEPKKNCAPWPEQRLVRIPLRLTCDALFRYLGSWDPIQETMQSIGPTFLETAYHEAQQLWGTSNDARPVCFELFSVVAG